MTNRYSHSIKHEARVKFRRHLLRFRDEFKGSPEYFKVSLTKSTMMLLIGFLSGTRLHEGKSQPPTLTITNHPLGSLRVRRQKVRHNKKYHPIGISKASPPHQKAAKVPKKLYSSPYKKVVESRKSTKKLSQAYLTEPYMPKPKEETNSNRSQLIKHPLARGKSSWQEIRNERCPPI